MLLVGVGQSALAQTTSSEKGVESAEEAVPAEDIVVTASRAAGSGFDAPTPVTTVSKAELTNSGVSNIADLLNTQIPSFRASATPSSATTRTAGAGNYLDLRGLGSARTLVLLDGRRHVPTTNAGLVNANVLPQMLVDRVDIVTGGASAAWGSDAVAGVVNFVLKDHVDGLIGEARAGISGRGDNQNYQLSLAWGTKFAGGRGSFMIAGDFADSQGIDDQGSRGWGRKDWQVISNPRFAPGNGQPRNLIRPNVHTAVATPGGMVFLPDGDVEFGPGGTPIPFIPGTDIGSLYQVGGSGINPGRFNQLVIPERRGSVFARASYELANDVTLFAEGSYAESRSRFEVLPTFDFGSIEISRDNAFLPASIAAVMDRNGLDTIDMGRINYDFGFVEPLNRDRVYRGVIGVKGKISDWKWDVYYQRGEARRAELLLNNRKKNDAAGKPIFASAVDAVLNPATGAIVCRSSLTNPSSACVPLNLFGEGSPSAAALGYILGTSSRHTRMSQDVIAANLRGEPFSTWAGPVALAFGAEYRRDKTVYETDPIANANGWFTGNGRSYSGGVKVKEGYLEAIVPLMRESALGQSLDINGAVRYTEYDIRGRASSLSATTWKLGASYEPVSGVRFRGTYSRDIRAPNADELFSAGRTGLATINDPRFNNAQALVTVAEGGNRNLDAEVAKTLTFGTVLAPAFLPGLQLSVDYYDIKLRGAIGANSAQNLVNRCANGETAICAFITRNPTTNLIERVSATLNNLAQLHTRGQDFDLSYRTAIDGIGNDARATFRLIATHVDTLEYRDGASITEGAGSLGPKLGGVPKWRFTASAGLEVDDFNVYLAGRYVGGGSYDRTNPSFYDDNSVDSAFYVDATIGYDLLRSGKKSLSVTGTVRNLFDRDPPIVPTPDLIATPTNTVFHDVIGRYFSLGISFKY